MDFPATNKINNLTCVWKYEIISRVEQDISLVRSRYPGQHLK